VPINFAVKLVATIALEAAQVGLQAMQRTRGPRLSELQVSTADFGTPIPDFIGARIFTCAITHAEDLKEVKHTSKGKGGKQTTYSYLATFDATICDCQVDKVLKIWLDERLCLDRTGKGPVSPIAAFLSGNHADSPPVKLTHDNMRIYLGTEDQLPDPRYVEFCEHKFGPNSAPASRGEAHIFFEELPTDNFGNRVPSVKVLVVTAAEPHYPFDIRDGAGSGIDGVFSPDGLFMYQQDTSTLFVWDTATRTLINKVERTSGFECISAFSGGLYALGGGFTPESHQLWLYGPDGSGGTNTTPSGFDIYTPGFRCVSGTPFFYPVTNNETYYGIPGTGSSGEPSVVAVVLGFPATHFFEGPNGSAWAVGVDAISEDNLNVAQIEPNILAPAGAHMTAGGQAWGMWNGDGGILVYQNGDLLLLDAEDPTTILAGPVSVPVSPAYVGPAFNSVRPGADRLWLAFTEINTRTLEVLRSVNPDDWLHQTMTGGCYDFVNDGLVTHEFGSDEITWRYLDRAVGAAATDGDVVAKICTKAGMTDFDVSSLTSPITGYSWTRASGKAQLEPLIDIHDVDARPHGFTIDFLPRGGSPVLGISSVDFARGDGGGPRYKTAEPQDTDLPKILRVNFADNGFDQQVNNVLSPLPADAVDTQRDTVIDLTTYVTVPDDAQQKADRYMRGLWNRRAKVDNALTAQLVALEPGDIVTLSLDDILWNCKLDRQTFVGMTRMECTLIRDERAAALLNPATEGPPLNRDPEVIQVPSPVRGFVIDAPLRGDADADIRPLLYMGAGAYAQMGFPGAVIFEGSGSGDAVVYDELAATITDAATWGTTSTALGDVATAWLWDRANSVTVRLQSGSLTSATEADVNADPALNLLVFGAPGRWEYVNFTTATLNVDGSYTLSGFKRGRRGTEWATGLHQAGDIWVVAADLEGEEQGADEVGGAVSFKAQTIGRDPEAAPAIALEPYQGQTLMPYAPARVVASFDGADWTFTVRRRTRIGGRWNGTPIPLSEVVEAYSIDVLDGLGAVVRTLNISAAGNTITYTGAQQTEDFGSIQTTKPALVAYQISDTVGRGFALAA
jgi:hypothetical protein